VKLFKMLKSPLFVGGIILSCGGLLADDEAPKAPPIPNDTAQVTEAPLKAVSTDQKILTTKSSGPVSAQPRGVLSGKIVYIGAGHGWTAEYPGSGKWYTQRGNNNSLVEDLGNIDQLNFVAEQLYNAGATIVSFRPLGRQVLEVVIDNDDPQAEFLPENLWGNSSQVQYYGDASDVVHYRYANTSTVETAVARYTPNLPEAGFYPVYAWTRDGSDRVSDQTYRIVHSGGATEVQINHRRVGKGWIYLGEYYFESGSAGYVEITNKSDDSKGSVVVADAIRFGNGMGDMDRGAGISGQSREDENSRYWVQNGMGQGANPLTYDQPGLTDYSDNVSTPPRMTAWMNRESEGALTDRVYLGFHTNAYDPGSLGLYNWNNDAEYATTTNQKRWAFIVANEFNSDLVAVGSPPMEYNWPDRVALGKSLILDRGDIEFGEIHGYRINYEMDATIIEVAAHGNKNEAELCLDMNVRRAAARAALQSIVRYFNEFSDTALAFPPDTPSAVWGKSTSSESVTLGWTAPASNEVVGDPATGYVIYQSGNGYGYVAVAEVDGASKTSFTLNDLPNDETTYFRVASKNAGGESVQSEPIAVCPASSGNQDVLIVNGFDRIDRMMNPPQVIAAGVGGISAGGCTTYRIRPRQINAGDYVIQHAEAIFANETPLVSCSNEAVVNGSVSLDDYQAVFWIVGEESTEDETFNVQEQALVTSYLNQGGNFFVSGAEIAWDLEEKGAGKDFFNNVLKASYVADDSSTYTALGASRGIFKGLVFGFSPGGTQYDAQSTDTINPVGDAIVAATYATGGNAAIQYEGADPVRRVVLCTFPFELIRSEDTRAEAMKRVLDYFQAKPVSGK
jgi:fibronectin type III domain protein